MTNPIKFFIKCQHTFIFRTDLTQKITLAALIAIGGSLGYIQAYAIDKNLVEKEIFSPEHPLISAVSIILHLSASKLVETHAVNKNPIEIEKENFSPSYTVLAALIIMTYVVVTTALVAGVLLHERDVGNYCTYCSKQIKLLNF